MYPCFIWWWTPVIYSPLSGSVTQDISPTFVSLLYAFHKQVGVVAAQLSIIHQQNEVLANAVLGSARLSAESDEQGQARNKLLELSEKFDRLDRQGEETRTQETKALLDLMRRLDPVEFARIVRMEAEALHGGGSAPRE